MRLRIPKIEDDAAILRFAKMMEQNRKAILRAFALAGPYLTRAAEQIKRRTVIINASDFPIFFPDRRIKTWTEQEAEKRERAYRKKAERKRARRAKATERS